MIQAIIVEDEELSAKRLARILGQHAHDIAIDERLDTVADTVAYLQKNKATVDLIFLDIHLADGHSFEIFNQIEIDIPIIFTTAYDQYALQAFQQTSVDYLMKPIQEEELVRSLDKFRRYFNKDHGELVIDYAFLAKALQKEEETLKKRFMVQVGSKIRSVDVEDIHLFYAENKACFLITNEGKRYTINYTLEKLMPQLDSEQFFRLNRKIIVQITSIQEVYQFSKSRFKVTLKHSPGFDVFIPLERMGEFKRWMNK
jgi:DNA-binding LytR/AlgR family response regulator